jgi:hypothetical protein
MKTLTNAHDLQIIYAPSYSKKFLSSTQKTEKYGLKSRVKGYIFAT